MVKAGKIRVPKPLPEIKPEDVPYDLPLGWEWVRLGDVVVSIIGGGTPSKNNPSYWGGDIPWASVKDLNVDIYLEKTIDSITNEGLKNSSSNLIPSGSIIVCTRMGLGKICINKVEIAINQDLKALTVASCVDKMFFFKKYRNYNIKGQGVTVKGIRQDELLSLLFPLPPLAEQKRIVARIDQLMACCDELEKLRSERANKQSVLLNAVMSRM
ncbi:MAG: restriction endonuclease subunit S [Chlorobium sp.]